ETWVLYDRMLIDDEIYNALSKFRPGVRVLVVADSCHSGDSIRDKRALFGPPMARFLERSKATAVVSQHQGTYSRALSRVPPRTANDLRCSSLLLAACKSNQVALDGNDNGLFTSTLKRIWVGGRFMGNYVSLIRSIQSKMPSFQTPILQGIGPDVGEFE